MISLSTSTGYAIKAMARLCPKGETAYFIRNLAEEAVVPAPYLAKLVQRLSAGGLVISKRGYKGGIRLSRPAGEISLADIDDAIEGGREPDRCLLGMESCTDERACPAHAFWKVTRAAIRAKLESTSLLDVMKFEEARARENAAAPAEIAPGVTVEASAPFAAGEGASMI